jgi:hypothetical protein
MAIGAGTSREKDYIAAVSAFYKDWTRLDHLTRARKYQVAMARLYATYPDDREAAVFYALSLVALASHDDPSYPDQRKAGAILEKVFAEQPQHPGVAYYIIHAYDNPGLANQALNAARRYAQIAPSSVHALHMPSHIFIQVGSWQEAIDSNLASIAAARKYSARNHLSGHFRVKHQACGVGNAQIRIERVWPLPDRVRALHYARTVRDVCGCLPVGENRCSRIRSLAGRHRRLWSKARDGRVQVASVPHSLPTRLREGQSLYTRDWRFSARRM